MRSLDFSPLMRATVGFDRMMNLLDSVDRVDEGTLSYPPYNIEKLGEDEYRISMAVAGFSEDELDITAQDAQLTIAGRKDKAESEGSRAFLYRGIAARSFERRFQLADHIKVRGARLENGLLHVDLVREVPEEMKPRSIKIERTSGDKPKVIEGKAA